MLTMQEIEDSYEVHFRQTVEDLPEEQLQAMLTNMRVLRVHAPPAVAASRARDIVTDILRRRKAAAAAAARDQGPPPSHDKDDAEEEPEPAPPQTEADGETAQLSADPAAVSLPDDPAAVSPADAVDNPAEERTSEVIALPAQDPPADEPHPGALGAPASRPTSTGSLLLWTALGFGLAALGATAAGYALLR